MSVPVHPQFTPWLAEQDACGVGFIYRPTISHQVLAEALQAVACLEHRGGCGADRDSGDGTGVLTAIPWRLLAAEGWPTDERLAVGMAYLPPGYEADCRAMSEKILQEEGFALLGWRVVPTVHEVLGRWAKQTCPQIEQMILRVPQAWTETLVEDRLLLARRRMKHALKGQPSHDGFYIASLSNRTIVYKGMVRAEVLGHFYPDLMSPLFESNWVVYHRRFSTNTLPRWPLAQPLRMLGHNGEINTLLGNRNWMKAREPGLTHPRWADRKSDLLPVIYPDGSDSASLDNALELLVRSGQSPEAALMQLIPEAYRHQPELADYPGIVDFYEYYSGLQEPWDGPALIVYGDGHTVGALLDRNGLRPARYILLADGSVIVGSEAGVVDVPLAQVIEKGRLGPGQMLTVDLASGQVLKNWQIKERVACEHPYGEWVRAERRALTPMPFISTPQTAAADLLKQQLALGYGTEDVEHIIEPMAQTGREPVYSMGDDTPPPVLSQQPRVLYDYFKQRFAQVTNPAIDPLREKLVMSLETHLGRRANLLLPTPEGARMLHLMSPVLNEGELESLLGGAAPFVATRMPLLFEGDLDRALTLLCEQAVAAVRAGKMILVLSDRGVVEAHAAIPTLLAVGAVHHHLIREGLRLECSLVVETAQCWSTHHFACLLGYGAQAICPYLAFETVRHWFNREKTQTFLNQANGPGPIPESKEQQLTDFVGLTVEKAQLNYKKAVEGGLLKVLSKMGISLLASYVGAQIFECVGLGHQVIERCFTGTTSRLGGLEVAEIAQEVLAFHTRAFPGARKLINYGLMSYRADGEYHGNNPQVVKALHGAIGLNKKISTPQARQEQFQEYASLVRERPPAALRDLLTFQSDREPISLDAVEPATEIVRRFCTGGMSLGALSKEAHEVLAIAMNRLGGKSNSGEGGEDPLRYHPIQQISAEGTSPDFPGLYGLQPGDLAASAIRQVASGRFGVTPEYLATANQLEIKIAQGAKPGEGGQLPGHKVSAYIAKLRRSKPGVSLISPPPHHDIYSIEDLAQLIFDLHQVNPQAHVSVKLVAEVGIGTVAAGVAKANADIIQISGHDGGTGASPLSSIKHAGLPWELGLAEVHQVLLANGLRDRVLLRVDGGLRAGWEVVMAALLGANEYGFGSIALIAEGCIMARICHTNNCPVGVTSQKEALRKRFPGTPEPVVAFFLFIAEEVRHTLAQLGYRSLGEILGRVDLLKPRTDLTLPKVPHLNLDCLTTLPGKDSRDWLIPPAAAHSNGPVLGDELLADADVQKALAEHGTVTKTLPILNTDRGVGARLSGAIARRYGDTGFTGQIVLNFEGTAGQSFGAFNVQNLCLILTGEANDYVGKGMNGGEIVLRPFRGIRYRPSENVIIGNTCLYGATGGRLFAAGRAGERFAVRNSRAQAVVEGAGDHCCEYMTGGTVVVLGGVGRNFGAGMTGGLAYVLDEDGLFQARFNPDGEKRLQRVPTGGEEALKALIQAHYRVTDSDRAREILEDWTHYLPHFWQVVPPAEADHPEALEVAPVRDSVAAQE
ncbi:glutamate synthase large subunit [Anthocerotibacter panamensis]|uniref:glutamate synthase large subunit n=1 Tax=Anthocerotibacter panamensis TaxID=2857077 RepID=UPI001C406E09|nr:glutamate synthase large subunit [Anthocerotibacter panamensis]